MYLKKSLIRILPVVVLLSFLAGACSPKLQPPASAANTGQTRPKPPKEEIAVRPGKAEEERAVAPALESEKDEFGMVEKWRQEKRATEGAGAAINASAELSGDLFDLGASQRPPLQVFTQKTGTVVIAVCADGEGRVTEAQFQSQGSTTNDRELRQPALNNARSWLFNSSGRQKTCGRIIYRFFP